MKRTCLISMIVALMISPNLVAQRTMDVEGGKDYPLVSRFEGSIIEYYKVAKWDSYPIPVSLTDNQFHWKEPLPLEGKVIRIQYSAAPDNNPAYVLKNFESAFNKAGFKVIMVKNGNVDLGEAWYFTQYYYWDKDLIKFGWAIEPRRGGNHAYIAAKTNNGTNDIYIAIYISAYDNITLITQDIIEVEAAATGMVTATSLKDGITSNGHIALDGVFFDTGVSTIKAESTEALKNIAEYLKGTSDSKFVIVGHTDIDGTFEANMKLSEERAKAVMNELVTKFGVKPEQLKSFGLASLAPATSNATEKGKEKNRRVEIVKQ
jgi:outer membrane protein OmpA-like peptidoglycan-associated protein